MKTSLCQVLCTCGSAIGLLTTTVNPVNAAFFFDCESPLPDTVFSAGITPSGVVPFFPSIETINDNSFLRLSNELPASEGGFASSFFVNTGEIFEDVQVSALLNPAGDSNDQVAVAARVNVSALNGYFATIDFAQNRLLLSKAVGGEVTVLADAFDVLPALDLAYFVELEVIGNQLTGRFFDETGDLELSSLSFRDIDNPLMAGVSGLAVDISKTAFPGFTDPNNSTFDNLSSRSISVPEPSSLLSLLTVGAIATITRSKKKS